MTKKILSILLALVMVLAMAPVSVFAEDDILDYLTYEINDGEVRITDCNESSISGDVVVPDTIEGYPVTEIGWNAFGYCTSLTSITIPESVTLIDDSAFGYCTSLASIAIPDSVTSIGSSAFDNTAYYNDELNWENGVLYIGNHLIDAKKDITECEIKDGTLTIANVSFYECTSLESITIPDSVTSIGGGAFRGCTSLESITIPDGVTAINWETFVDCTSLKSITIPDSVTSIGFFAFVGTGYYNDESNWDNGVLYIGNHLIEAKNNITECNIKDGTLTINYLAFAECENLANITIPDSVTSIGYEAFYNCTSLTSVTIPNSVTSIDEGAFLYCTSLTNISIPDSVKSIGYGAFCECTSLTNITILNSVTSIADFAIGYYENDNDEVGLVDSVTIYGIPGSTAEAYANENGITFVAITPEEDATVPDEPVLDEPTTDEPVTDEPVTDEPVTDKPITDEPITDEPITDEPATDEPATDEPVTDEPITDEPVQDTSSNVLTPNADSNITITDTVANLAPEMSVEAVIKSVENKKVLIVSKDGTELATDALVGTGSKIQVLDKDGNVLSEYEVMVKSDVDGNGKITPADARLALRASANLDKLEGVYETAANYDGENTVSTSDARMILRKSAGLEK